MGYYSTTADPSDDWSNHWSNGTHEETDIDEEEPSPPLSEIRKSIERINKKRNESIKSSQAKK